ncbi:hypothetical protein ACHAXR_006508 [Thalassiosira sp. AJA248-18]
MHLSSSSLSSAENNNDHNNDEINSNRPSKPRSKRRKSSPSSAASAATAAASSNSRTATKKKKPKKQQQQQQKTKSKPKQPQQQKHHYKSTMSTALCIVPPDNAWDTIQRARHLARDTTFYKWPPAIRLFHPFAPKNDIPSLVGLLAEWIEDEGGDNGDGGDCDGGGESTVQLNVEDSMLLSDEDILKQPTTSTTSTTSPTSTSSSSYLESFSVTLDSIQILPHMEVLDARIEALEERMPQRTLGSTVEEREYQKRKAEGLKLIEEEERRGLERKLERDRKRRLKKRQQNDGVVDDGGGDDDENENNVNGKNDEDSTATTQSNNNKNKNKNNYNGPCVIYLAPNDESRQRLENLRERLRMELFPMYNAFSPSSSVSPYPEQLPRKVTKQASRVEGEDDEKKEASSKKLFRPLLPIARFPTVDAAIKIAKVLQQTWDPLTFNVTDIQFVSRYDESELLLAGGGGGGNKGDDAATMTTMATTATTPVTTTSTSSSSSGGVGFGLNEKHNGIASSSSRIINDGAKDRMALTSSGEVEDVGKQGIYGCDAMVMLWGEEPEEELMEEEASLSMIMDDDDDDDEVDDDEDSITTTGVDANNGRNDANNPVMTTTAIHNPRKISNNGKKSSNINYNEIFTTAEREYQRMQAHEELSTSSYDGMPMFSSLGDDEKKKIGGKKNSGGNIEAWLDSDDDMYDDEGATVVIGRAQFFMGAMREFIGMPASSAIDAKDRIMGGGISAVARRKGSVHRLSESWEVGDYGLKDSDRRT